MSLRTAINRLVDGDTLLLEGTFTFLTSEDIIFLQGRNNITIGSYGDGAIIEGNATAVDAGISLIVLVDNTNITIENLTIGNNYGPDSRGIFVYGSGDTYTIQNNTFTNIGWSTDATAYPIDDSGVAFGANAIIVLGNKNPTSSGIVNTNGEITNMNILNNTVTNCITGTNESVTLIGNIDGFLVDGNTVTDVTNIGIDAAGHFDYVQDFETGEFLNTNYPELNQARNGVISGNRVTNAVSAVAVSAGIYCDGCRDVVIKENIVSGSGTGFSIGCEVGGGNKAENVSLVNNIARDNLQSGMFMGSITSEGETELSSVDNCIVRNNVFYNNNTLGLTSFNTFAIALSKGDGNEISNNIIHLIEGIEGSTTNGVGITVFDNIAPNITNYIITNNLFYKTSGTVVTEAEQLNANGSALTITGSVLADPSFIDLNNDLFEIPDTSAAVNAGSAITLVADETDYDGDPRVQGAIVDIGAQETSVPSTITVTGITLAPETADLVIGDTIQVIATVNPTDATDQTITWTSDNESIVTVDATGLVTAIANGEVTITATTNDGGFTGTTTITIADPVTVLDRCDLTGFIVGLPVGSYDEDDLEDLGVDKKDISGAEIANGYRLIGFKKKDIKGDAIVLTADTCLEDTDYENKIRSVIVETIPGENPAATIYDHCSLQGWSVALGAGSYTEDHLIALGADKKDISAVQITAGFRMIGYDKKDFDGDFVEITSDTCLTNIDFANEIRSLIIEEISSDTNRIIQEEKVVEELTEKTELTPLLVFPNPAKSVLNISGVSTRQTIQIYNAIGVKVIDTAETSINIDALPVGMYFVKVSEQTIRFIKN
ncbi:hypothetical protein GCM10022393_12340 [Aquimarina addita]|uniref:BIG2 domain-containing protein n=1 Tax=Aquimarina addita TaxID=870485 RepID=A0ABP7XEK7_9FLAO